MKENVYGFNQSSTKLKKLELIKQVKQSPVLIIQEKAICLILGSNKYGFDWPIVLQSKSVRKVVDRKALKLLDMKNRKKILIQNNNKIYNRQKREVKITQIKQKHKTEGKLIKKKNNIKQSFDNLKIRFSQSKSVDQKPLFNVQGRLQNGKISNFDQENIDIKNHQENYQQFLIRFNREIPLKQKS